MADSFPQRAFFMPGFMTSMQEELRSRGVEVHELKTQPTEGPEAAKREMQAITDPLNETDLVAGIPWYVEVAMRIMGIPVPTPPDYPTCLQHLLRRKIWLSTLKAVEADLASGTYSRIFIKPSEGAKAFSGTVVHGPRDDMLSGDFGFMNPEIFAGGGPDAPVLCSEVLEMNSEYAVYVVNGEIRGTSHYMCNRTTCRCQGGEKAAAGEPVVELDMALVEEAVRLVSESEETQKLTAYRADFVLSRRDAEAEYETTLCEINDGYVSGKYDDFGISDFTDMVVSRFAALQSTRL